MVRSLWPPGGSFAPPLPLHQVICNNPIVDQELSPPNHRQNNIPSASQMLEKEADTFSSGGPQPSYRG